MNESLKFVRGGHAVGPEIEMQPILHGLGLRNGKKVDDGPSSVCRGDAHSAIGLLDDLPSKDRAPEVGHGSRVKRIHDNIGEATGHGVTIPTVPEDSGLPAGERVEGHGGGGGYVQRVDPVRHRDGDHHVGRGQSHIGEAEPLRPQEQGHADRVS